MTEVEYDALIEECRLRFNEGAKALGTPMMGVEAFREVIENPLTDPRMELTRMEDREYPGRNCAWCFHPRNSDECQFAAKHVPYREMFGGG